MSSPKTRSKSPLVQGDRIFGRRRARFGERCAFAGVVAAVELAVGAFEVVLFEAGVIADAPVIVDLANVEIRRLVFGVV